MKFGRNFRGKGRGLVVVHEGRKEYVYILISNPEAAACFKLNIQKTLKLTLVTMCIFCYQILRLMLVTN